MAKQDEIDFGELFDTSYEYVLQHKADFFADFYKNFLASSLAIRDAFKGTDIKKQEKMLKKALGHMILFYSSRKASEYLTYVAYMHKYKIYVDTSYYDNFMDALLVTLEELYPDYCNDCAVAWRVTLAPGIEFMKHITDNSA